MADITKLVDRIIPPTMRSQLFTQVDAGTGDVLMVGNSLGHPASNVLIEAVQAMVVRFNVYQTVFPRRTFNDLMYSDHLSNVTSGMQVKITTTADIVLSTGETYELDGAFPVNDIEIVLASGVFNVTTF